MSGLLTIKEVAGQLKVSLATVYLLCSDGKLPHIRVGRKRGTIRVKTEDLGAFVEASRAKAHRLTDAAGMSR